MPKKHYKLIHHLNNDCIENEYPDNMDVIIQFDGEHISDLVNGMKLFAIACGFSERVVSQYFVNDPKLYRKHNFD